MKQMLDTIKLLENQRDEWLKKVSSIENTIETLKQSLGYSAQTSFNGNGIGGGSMGKKIEKYDVNGSFKTKIMFLLKAEQRFLHIREMAAMAHSMEPTVSEEDFLKKLSPVLSTLKKEGQLTNVTSGKSLRNTFWGSPKWIDTDGKIINGHEYLPEFLFETGKQEYEI